MEQGREQNEVTLEEVLFFRDCKVANMEALRAKYPDSVLVSLGMNIPGPYKTGAMIEHAFDAGIQAIMEKMKEKGIPVVECMEMKEHAGYLELFVLEKQEAFEVKKYMVELEKQHKFGRIFDLDVYDGNGDSISRESLGLEGRKCLICGQDAKVCGSRRIHTWQELRQVVDQILYEK